MPDASIVDLVRDYETGRLLRDKYWALMQRHHLALLNYCHLLRSGDLERVEIDAVGLRIRLRNGLQMRWSPADVRTAPNILINHGTYEKAEFELVQHFASACPVVFDV